MGPWKKWWPSELLHAFNFVVVFLTICIESFSSLLLQVRDEYRTDYDADIPHQSYFDIFMFIAVSYGCFRKHIDAILGY